MNEVKDKAIALKVRLKSSDSSSSHPRATNYTNVSVAQGIAYVDFGFLEPVLLGAITKAGKDGQEGPKGIEGQLVARMAMGVDVLARLQLQIEKILAALRAPHKAKQES